MTKKEKLKDQKITECSCDDCKKMCQNTPCWPVPEDIERLFDTKHIGKFRLMCFDSDEDINDTGSDVDILL